jgi:hypothetical protein
MRNLDSRSTLDLGPEMLMTRMRRAWFTLLVAVVQLPSPAAAQIRASELGSMSQVIDGTKISITYSRPRTRGRSPIFGTPIAHWGETWTPGANWATIIDVNKDITLNGRALPKGKYSVWMILKERGDWTTVFEPDWHRFHMEPPDSNAKQIRVATRVDSAPFMDVLTWSMPEITASGGTLTMHWGTTRASLKVGVSPSLVVTLPEADARPYLGRYEYVEKGEGGATKTTAFIVSYEDKTMKARWEPNDAYMQTFAMIRVGPDIFAPGLYDKSGEIYEVLRPDMIFTFKRVNGRPTTFEVRDDSDELFATGKRKP